MSTQQFSMDRVIRLLASVSIHLNVVAGRSVDQAAAFAIADAARMVAQGYTATPYINESWRIASLNPDMAMYILNAAGKLKGIPGAAHRSAADAAAAAPLMLETVVAWMVAARQDRDGITLDVTQVTMSMVLNILNNR